MLKFYTQVILRPFFVLSEHRIGLVVRKPELLAIYRPSGCTVASGVVGVVVVGVCNRSQMRTSKLTCLIFVVSIGLDPG